nr:zinc finger, CCHC-type [Tanacetum cinerariifolium]
MPVPLARQVLPPDVLNTHTAWVKASKEIAGLMLMTIDLDIQKNLEHLGAYDMLKELKTLYAQQADHELLQTVREFHACKQEEGKSEYDGFMQNYNMHSMGKTVTELHAMLKLQEQTLPPKEAALAFHAIRARRIQKNQKKKSHKAGLRGRRKLKPGALSLFVGDGHRAIVEATGEFHLYPKETMGYSFYYPPENKVFVARYAQFHKISLIAQEASGSLEDLEIIHKEDRLCLYVDAEKRKLGDLGEPTNYKAALLDPESDKWLNAMNVKMQSMRDNEVWEIVDLPLNAKTIGHKWLFKKKTDMDGAVHTYKARLVAKGFT